MAGKTIRRRARNLRQSANVPEQRAWSALRQFRRRGFPVRRQHPIGPYIVDFAIVCARLAIEIDGGVHRIEANASRDERRDKFLAAQGWRVLRIPAEHALHQDYLMQRIADALEHGADAS